MSPAANNLRLVPSSQSGMGEDRPQKRSPLELLYMTAVVAFTTAAAALLVIGLPTLFVVRAFHAGISAWGAFWGVLAAVWVGGILQAVVRDRETRGWLAFGLLGWTSRLRR